MKINITYVATLEAREDAMAFVLPTSIAPRYSPAVSLHASTTEDIQGLAPPSTVEKWFGLDIQINVTCCSAIKTVTCPTHGEDMHCNLSGTTGQVALNDVTMDRDVVVMIQEEKVHQPRANIEISKENGSSTMTGFVTFYPQIELPDQKREFIFVVDRSGSMGGQKISQVRDTLLLFLRSLPASCSFNIIGFGSSFEPLFLQPQPYNDSTLKTASKYVASIEANMGGTQILAPLIDVFSQGVSAAIGTDRQVFVLTDGQVSNDVQVFDLIRQHCSEKAETCRLFCVGIGQNVSRHLVTGMSRAGRGTARFVEDGSIDTLRVKVLGQLKQSLQPSLDNVSIEWRFPKRNGKRPAKTSISSGPIKTILGYSSPSIDETNAPHHQSLRVFPSKNPPIFNLEKYLSFAIFPPGSMKPDGVEVKCETPYGPLVFDFEISDNEVFGGSIARKLAARMAIAEFEDSLKWRSWGRNVLSSDAIAPLTEDEALKLALDNNLASNKTSFISTSDDVVVDPGVLCQTEVIPQQVNHFPSLYNAKSMIAASNAMDMSTFDELQLQQQIFFKQSCAFYKRSQKVRPNPFSSLANALFSSEGRRSDKHCPAQSRVFLRAQHAKRTNRLKWLILGDSKGSLPGHSGIRIACMAMAMVVVILLGWFYPRFKYFLFLLPVLFFLPLPAMFMMVDQSRTKKDSSVTGMQNKIESSKQQMEPPQRGLGVRDDRMMSICMLQKADGSFLLNNNLLEVVGFLKSETDKMYSQEDPFPTPIEFGTALAVVVLRVEFEKKRNVWELQEQKALAFLDHSTGDDKKSKVLLQEMEREVRAALSQQKERKAITSSS